MDVGLFLGELLMQEGEVSVPGLGYFVQERRSGYYNEEDGKFYPPYYQVQFGQQLAGDNESLAQHLADKKNISLASSKYFIEKYATGLKRDALTSEVAVGNLGWFYTHQARLTFKPGGRIIDAAAFYGYQPVKITKVRDSAGSEVPKQNYHTEPVYTPPGFTPEPEPAAAEEKSVVAEEMPIVAEEQVISEVTEHDHKQPSVITSYSQTVPVHQEAEEGEQTRRNPLRAILITLTVVAVLGVIVLVLYYYAPATYERLQFWKDKKGVVAVAKLKTDDLPQIKIINTDSVYRTLNDTTAKDSVAKVIVPPVIDSSKTRFEVIATSCRNIDEANTVIQNFKSIGIDAHIVLDAPGKRMKITVGTFTTRKEAETAMYKLITARKIRKDAYPIKIKTKQ